MGNTCSARVDAPVGSTVEAAIGPSVAAAAADGKPKGGRKNVFDEAPDTDFRKQKTERMNKSLEVAERIRGAIMEQPLLTKLAEEEIQVFVDYAERKDVAAGEIVINEGEKGDSFYIVQTGSFTFSKDGQELEMNTPKSSFGELALLFNAPRAATVTAVEDGILWFIDRSTFRHAIASAKARSRQELAQKLSRVEILQTLSHHQLEHLADVVIPRTVESGSVVIRKGETGHVLYLIEEGDFSFTDIDGVTEEIVKGPGEFFGERALLTGDTRAATVTAKSEAKLLELSRQDFDKSLGPLKQILQMMSNKEVLESIELFSNLSAQEKMNAVRLFVPKTFRANEKIIREGERGESFFVIDSGTVVVTKASDKSFRKELGKGAFFGEMALLSRNDKRQASVTAVTEVMAFTITQQNFASIVVGDISDVISKTAEDRAAELAAAVRRDIPFNELKRVAVLGAGTFGRVTLVQHAKSGHVYALKALHKSEIVQHKQQANVMNEKNIMMQCHHPFILHLYNTYKDSHRLFMLLEYCPGGELFTVLHTAHRDGVDPPAAKFYCAGVAMALSYLSDRNIMYRDLKPENMLVDQQGYPKLIDFGFAKIKNGKTYTLCGTPEYMAPEIIMGRGYDKAVDWWAFGVLVYESLAGYSPFCDPHGANQQVICQNIVAGHLRFPRTGFDAHSKELCRSLLNMDPSRRPGMGQRGGRDVLESSWFSTFDFQQFTAKKMRAPWLPKIKSPTDTSHFDPYHVDESVDESYHDEGDWDRDF
uniref:cGMP-dependent protein kinase n=1 Tax=Rhizochromulina marina TaxID=1034831 RepID=A0A7S2R3M6_9STRA|mmetsp:Transcript_10061/g.28650  ORF Transcript_10061/g.28650 Transcript_10061/m.28650 type:complete len:763 (+) Transcript_10061:200-2488(+)